MLKVDKISVSYNIKGKKMEVLHDFSLELEQGEVLAILGPSGCGKSTLIQVLAGMLSVDSGRVIVSKDKMDTLHHPKNHKIAVIPQNCGLLPWKSVRQNCLLPLKLQKTKVDGNKLSELIETCRSLNVDTLLDRYPRELSGGQIQRVALARAFLQDPDLLLMDEPFSSLDEMTRLDAWALFLKIWKIKKPTTILVTHSMEEALYLGKKIIVLSGEKGRIAGHLNNPYFGLVDTDDTDILSMRKQMRELLKPASGGEIS